MEEVAQMLDGRIQDLVNENNTNKKKYCWDRLGRNG